MAKSLIKSENTEFLKGITVVGFDFDDTLVDERHSIKKRWQKVLQHYSFLSPKLEKTFFKICQEKGPSYKFHLDDALSKLKIEKKNKNKILFELRKTVSNSELLLKGALELLKELKKKDMKVGIITDGKKSSHEERIKRAGIYKFMDFIYYGNGKKEKKPNRKKLEGLMRLCGEKFPNNFLYVGNDFKNDIKGMLDVGIMACWVTQEKSTSQTAKLLKVKNLRELCKKVF